MERRSVSSGHSRMGRPSMASGELNVARLIFGVTRSLVKERAGVKNHEPRHKVRARGSSFFAQLPRLIYEA